MSHSIECLECSKCGGIFAPTEGLTAEQLENEAATFMVTHVDDCGGGDPEKVSFKYVKVSLLPSGPISDGDTGKEKR